MPTTLRKKLSLGILSAFLLFGWVLPAAGQQLAVLRIGSLDAAFGDAETVAQRAGVPFNRDAILGLLLSVMGISDPSIVDPQRPLTLVLPVEGMMLAQRGVVAMLPTVEPAAAIEKLARGFTGHQTEGALHVFSANGAPALFAQVQPGYLAVGSTRDLVSRFDFAAAAAGWDGPPGNIGLEVFLQPVAPLIQTTLMTAKEGLKEQLRQQATQAGKQAPLDPASTGRMIDLYLDMVRDLLNEIDRVQIALQVSADHFQFHKRLAARTGSTFAELAAAQKGGLPPIARLLDPAEPVVIAGNMEMTPAFRTVLKRVAREYLAVLDPLVQSLLGPEVTGGDGSAGSAAWNLDLTAYSGLVDRSIDCMRGDFAETFSFGGDGTLSFVQIFGMRRQDACRTFIDDYLAQIRADLSKNESLSDLLAFGEESEVAGVTTRTVTIDPTPFIEAAGEADPQAREALNAVYGEGGMTLRLASAEDLILFVAGKDGAARLGELIGASKKPGGGGVDAATFRPLPAGPGFFQLFDLGMLLEGFASTMPEEARNDEQFAAVKNALRGPAGRVPTALRFDASGATFHLAVPLKAIEVAADLAAQSRASEAAPEEPAAKPKGQ